jgi:hypothetical protein
MRKLILALPFLFASYMTAPAFADDEACMGTMKELSSVATENGTVLTKLPADQMKNVLDHAREEGLDKDEADAVKQVYVQTKPGVPKAIIWLVDNDCVLDDSGPIGAAELARNLAPVGTGT